MSTANDAQIPPVKRRRHPLIRFLGSLKLTITLLAVFAVAIAAATFLEVRYGTTGARALVYDARWFEIVLALLVINLIVSLFANMPYRRHQTGYVITHAAFVIVLVSAGITRYFGYEGTMAIREGSSSNSIYSTKDYIQLTAGDEMGYFPIQLYRPGANHIESTVSIGDEKLDVAVTEYWPHYTEHLGDGPGGDPAVLYSAAGMGDRKKLLGTGEVVDIGSVKVRMVSDEQSAPNTGTTRGSLVIRLNGAIRELPVPETPPAQIEAAGYRFRITEFAPNFRVGSTPDLSAPMNNPAIRVDIVAPDGRSGERLLFAYHPDFNMGHSGTSEAFEELDLSYRYERNLYLSYDDSGGLSGIADFDVLLEKEQGSADVPEIGANQRFQIEPGTMIKGGNFAFFVHEYLDSAVEIAMLSENTNDPAAVRVEIQDDAGNQAEAVVRRSEDRVPIRIGGRDLVLQYGPVRIALPYSLYLDDFALVTYPGSDNPASFESDVRIFDEARGVDGRPARIYMNHPLDYRGFKHFQSSYDRDRKGTILSVNHDPGKLPTYFGYTFVGLGFLITLTRGILWNRNPGRRGASS